MKVRTLEARTTVLDQRFQDLSRQRKLVSKGASFART